MPAAETSSRATCDRLDARRLSLSKRLAAATRLLLDDSRLPSSSLLEELKAYRREYATLAAAVDAEPDCSLVDIRRRIAERERRRRASVMLSRCLQVRSSAACEAVSQFHALVRELQLRIETQLDVDALIVSIEDGSHPAIHLLQLVTQPETSSDQEWLQALELIKSEIDPRLAVAVARGRLSLRDAAGDALTPAHQETMT